jgi:NAD(P)H-flavin reductase
VAVSGTNERVTYLATIERIVEHNTDTRSLFLRLPQDTLFRFTPGQFISVAIPLSNETRIRPYTIASSPEDEGPLEIVFNLVTGGAGSEYLFRRGIGDQLGFTGPFGLFTLERPPEVETIFAAIETAVAPIRPMLRRALAASGSAPMKLFYAAPDRKRLLYTQEFEAAAKVHSNFTFEPVLEQQSVGSAGHNSRLFDRMQSLFVHGDQRRERAFYLCGVGQPVLDLRDLLRQAGYARRAVQYERW